jgi:methyl-accepting chemotaxis protein-1 (serine sensor receptor)
MKIMRRIRAFFANMTIRASLLWVMVFFAIMLVLGAALGVFSLHIDMQGFGELRRAQTLSGILQNMDTQYKSTLVSLARTHDIVAQDLAQPVAEGQSKPTAPSNVAASMLRFAHISFDNAMTQLKQLKSTPKPAELESAFKEVNDAYTSLMQEGIQPMFDDLGKLDLQGYATHSQMVSDVMEDRYALAASQFWSWRNTSSSGVFTEADKRFALVKIAVSVGLVLTILLVIATYIFLRRRVVKPLHAAVTHFGWIADGDMTHAVQVNSTNEIGQLYAALKRMQESLTRTVSAVRRGVDEINVGSREIAAGNTDLSSRTEEQAASLEETAASMEQLASTVKQNADNARQANQLAASASEVAVRGGSAVSEVVDTMHAISASSKKIHEIVSVIDGIAFQTNILALNAAVEAARAGEQGKGFAVVAGEVRSLAQRSAQAAKEIKQLIEDSVNKVSVGSDQVERAGATMQEIVTSVKRVTDIMGEISAASEEQSSGIDQVNLAVSQMDEVTQQNAALVEEAAAAAGSLQEQASQLADAVSVFKINAGEVIDVTAPALPDRASGDTLALAGR